MTLVIGMVERTQAFQVIDRRITMLESGQVFEENFNKTLLVRGQDGLCACSLSGPAFIEGIPTDHVIAEALVGEKLPERLILSQRFRVSRSPLWNILELGITRLSERWKRAPEATIPLTVDCVGLQQVGRAHLPFLRRYRPIGGSLKGISLIPRGCGKNSLHASFGGSGSNLLPDQKLKDDLLAATDSDSKLNALLAAQRRAANVITSVGRDSLVVQIVPTSVADANATDGRRITSVVAFMSEDPLATGIFFTPWFLDQDGIIWPSLKTEGPTPNLAKFLRSKGISDAPDILNDSLLCIEPVMRRPPPK